MTKYRSTQKIKRFRMLTSVEDDGHRLAAYQTLHGIVIVYRYRTTFFQHTVFQFVYQGTSYRLHYPDLLPDSVIDETVLQWVDEIIKANQ